MQILGREEGSDGEGQKKRRNNKNRYGMLKNAGRRFRVERMNIFGVRSTTEFSIDEVRETPYEMYMCFSTPGRAMLIQGDACYDRGALTISRGPSLEDIYFPGIP